MTLIQKKDKRNLRSVEPTKLASVQDFEEDYEFEVSNIPPILVNEINYKAREQGSNDDIVYAIFKCKNDCKTIFTK